MPKIFLSMFAEDGKPKVGNESKMLGVRIAPRPTADIPVDGGGNVHPQTGGMSVAPHWQKLPLHLIPKRLLPRARGHDDLICWRLGEGDFVQENLNADLTLRPDGNPNHGVVEPARVMAVGEYQTALGATRDDWIQDES